MRMDIRGDIPVVVVEADAERHVAVAPKGNIAKGDEA